MNPEVAPTNDNPKAAPINSNEPIKKNRILRTLVSIIYIAALLIAPTTFALWLYKSTSLKEFVYKSLTNDTSAGLGQFGDYFGGLLNPLCGLISIAILSLTLRQQIKWNQKQDQDNYDRNQKQDRDNHIRNQRQDFDNHFFTLLNLYNSVLQSIDKHSADGRHWRGRDCFLFLYREIKKLQDRDEISPSAAYEKFHEQQSWELCHYFRTVFHIFMHVIDGINAKTISEQEGDKYFKLVKSQLSAPELAILDMSANSKHRGRWDEINQHHIANPFEHLEDSQLVAMSCGGTCAQRPPFRPFVNKRRG